jgi:hypothetical protein
MPMLNLIVIAIPSYCNYILVRHHARIGMMAMMTLSNLSAACILIVFPGSSGFPVGASVNSLSISYLGSFRKQVTSPAFKRQIRSCRPLRVQVGSFLFLRKFTVLKIISFIIIWTLRSILLF